MTAPFYIFAVFLAVLAAGGTGIWLHHQGHRVAPVFLYLLFVLPFATGGFYSHTAAFTGIVLLVNLLFLVRKHGQLRFCCNLSSLAVAAVGIFYCISPLWAADKGMAVMGILRGVPLTVLALTLMQYSPEERSAGLQLVPITGAVMTVVSCLLLAADALAPYVSVGGRLSGFLQYPNAFAMFLLAGLVLNGSKCSRARADLIVDGILTAGIILSGSRAGIVLLFVAIPGIGLIKKQGRTVLFLALSLALTLALSLLVTSLGLLSNADRFLSMAGNSQSLLTRLAYYKDALPVIAAHPLGLGYLGYRATVSVFQTSPYSVAYVHNGFLQLLLDVGWAPTLLIAAAFGKSLFDRKAAPENRLLLLLLLVHCMVDFDLEFFPFWVILLCLTDLDRGEGFLLKPRKAVPKILWTALLAICLWLGTGDLLYQLGYTDAALAVTPFHTDAQCAKLMTIFSPEDADALADRILEGNPDNSLAWDAKAAAAFSRGQIGDMMEYKETAIRCNRYAAAEYREYFEMLWSARESYLLAGDSGSAEVCADKLRSIPIWLDSLDVGLMLPEEYTALLAQLEPQ